MSKARDDVITIFKSALQAVNPELRVKQYLKEYLKHYTNINNIYLLAFGKAACPMARAAASVLSDRVNRGIVITKYGHSDGFEFPENIELYEASHPLPDESGVKATGRAIDIVKNASENSLTIVLISGGGSALFCKPIEGITLKDKMITTDILLKAGADIFELNTVRKHLSAVKGGRLAETIYPANVLSLIISDVIGNRLDVIASGPTTPDSTTYQDAMDVIKKYDIQQEIHERVFRLLEQGIRGEIPETLKPGSSVFTKVENHIISSNRHCLEQAKNKALELGYEAEIITDSLQGEARNAARWLFSELNKRLTNKPLCLITGGETTVTVKGTGLGGRNTEFALSFAMEAEGISNVTFLSAGTDGTDGPTDAAGAVVDGETIKRAKSLGLDPADYLNRNDSYNFFKKTGELLITGPTGTNVMDIQIVLIRP